MTRKLYRVTLQHKDGRTVTSSWDNHSQFLATSDIYAKHGWTLKSARYRHIVQNDHRLTPGELRQLSA